MGVAIPVGHPVPRADAFRVGTGVHAAAVIKASKKRHTWLAHHVYSGVPAGEIAGEQKIKPGR